MFLHVHVHVHVLHVHFYVIKIYYYYYCMYYYTCVAVVHVQSNNIDSCTKLLDITSHIHVKMYHLGTN